LGHDRSHLAHSNQPRCCQSPRRTHHSAIQTNRCAPEAYALGDASLAVTFDSSTALPKEFAMQQMPDVDRDQAVNAHQLYFRSLFDSSRALSFPCDDCGRVPLDALSERARNNYFFARAAVGRDYGRPTVIRLERGSTH
jgi:hypothetical protein